MKEVNLGEILVEPCLLICMYAGIMPVHTKDIWGLSLRSLGSQAQTCALDIQGVSANADRNFSEISMNHTEKVLLPYCSLPLNLFNEVHGGFNNLVFN